MSAGGCPQCRLRRRDPGDRTAGAHRCRLRCDADRLLAGGGRPDPRPGTGSVTRQRHRPGGLHTGASRDGREPLRRSLAPWGRSPAHMRLSANRGSARSPETARNRAVFPIAGRDDKLFYINNLIVAGAGGIEPPNGGIKIRCLTSWLRPIREAGAARSRAGRHRISSLPSPRNAGPGAEIAPFRGLAAPPSQRYKSAPPGTGV